MGVLSELAHYPYAVDVAVAVYIVTGKLGGGKTLAAVSRIDQAFRRGCRVATNLDLQLHNLPSVSRFAKNTRLIRVPDRPSVDDIKAIGFGIEGVHSLADARANYDENKFGALVLDECGTWLNSRDWQAAGRKELINFLLHIRKHLWDVYLIIQDISLLDKQARKALAEHVVYCRRFDRVGIPIISSVLSSIGFNIKMPKFHMGIVKYGDQPTSITVERWWYNGTQLYDAYDTTQVFTEDYPHGIHSVLPPWFVFGKAKTNWNWRKAMRLTHIYLRQYSRTLLLAAGVFSGGVAVATFAAGDNDSPNNIAEIRPSEPFVIPEPDPHAVYVEPIDPYRISVASVWDDGKTTEVTFTDGDRIFSPESLIAEGFQVAQMPGGRYRLQRGSQVVVLSRF